MWQTQIVVPLVVALLFGWIALQAYKVYQSMMVSGKPNEWVVIVNNGTQKMAGIGL
jgi:hypothetical protein